MIDISTKVIVKKGALEGAHGRILLAAARGLNEGGDKVRTQVQRALWKQTGAIKYKSITKRISTIRAYDRAVPQSGIGPVGGASLSYAIIAYGPAMKREEFKFSGGRGGPVVGMLWGNPHVFKRSFRSSARGWFAARTGTARVPLIGFHGPNLAKEIGKDSSAAAFHAGVRTFVPPAILKHLAKAFR